MQQNSLQHYWRRLVLGLVVSWLLLAASWQQPARADITFQVPTGLADDLRICEVLGQNDVRSHAEARSTGGKSLNGGNINISANKVELSDRTQIFADSNKGSGGDIKIAADWVELEGGARIHADSESEYGGDITLANASRLVLRDESQVLADSASGYGGDIKLQAREILLPPRDGEVTAIEAIAKEGAEGDGGNICILADIFEAQAGGRVSVIDRGKGQAGDILVIADRVALKNDSSFDAISEGEGLGGGTITVHTQTYEAENYGRMVASSINTERAGIIELIADAIVLQGESDLQVLSTANAEGGLIEIDTNILIARAGSDIIALHNTPNDRDAGNIFVNAYKYLSLTGGSDINAIAQGTGRGGDIMIYTSTLNRSQDSYLCSRSNGGGKHGQLHVDARLQIGDAIEQSNACHPLED